MMTSIAFPPVEYRIYDDVPTPIFVVERATEDDFVIVYINKSYEDATGFSAKDMQGSSIRGALPKRSADLIIGNYLRCLSENAVISYEEALNLFGEEKYWRTSLKPVVSVPQGRARIVGSALDITKMRQFEIKQLDEIARLSDANEQIRSFAGLTAHDMRGPLANVISLTELVLNDFVDMGDRKREMIELCNDVAQKSLASIDEIMTHVHAAELNTGGRNATFQFGHVCSDLAALIDPSSELTIDYPRAEVHVDKLVLELSLRNLVENASRFCKSRIAILLQEDCNKGMLTFIVSDDGAGFSIDKIFPTDVPLNTPERADGRGFGLRTVTKLVKSRGGHLRILPSVGSGGARVAITLPGHIVSPVDNAHQDKDQVIRTIASH